MPHQDVITTELANLINQNSLENNSNTPDFILAQFLAGALNLLERAIKERDRWSVDAVLGLDRACDCQKADPGTPPPVSNVFVATGCEQFKEPEKAPLTPLEQSQINNILAETNRLLSIEVSAKNGRIRQLEASLRESEAACAGMRQCLERLHQLGGLGIDKHGWIVEALKPNNGRVIVERYEQVIKDLQEKCAGANREIQRWENVSNEQVEKIRELTRIRVTLSRENQELHDRIERIICAAEMRDPAITIGQDCSDKPKPSANPS